MAVNKTGAASADPHDKPARVRQPRQHASHSVGRVATSGTAEELDAFLDRLLLRGEQLKREFEELNARIGNAA